MGKLLQPITHGDGATLSAGNSTTTPLAISGTFTGPWEDISRYPQVTVTIAGRPSTFLGDGSVAPGSFFFEFGSDGATAEISVPIYVQDPGYFIPYPLANVGRYFRVRYLNDGGAAAGGGGVAVAQTAFALRTLYHYQATKELTRTLTQSIRDEQPVILTRGAVLIKDTNGQYANVGLATTDVQLPTADLWETLNLQGKGFLVSTVVTLVGATEQPFVLISNPLGSGKLVRIKTQFYGVQGTAAQTTLFRFYRGPTVTVNGTTLPISKTFPSIGSASVCSAFTQPTVSANGTLVAVVNVGNVAFTRDLFLSRFIEADGKLLVTAQQSGSVTNPHFFNQEWTEV